MPSTDTGGDWHDQSGVFAEPRSEPLRAARRRPHRANLFGKTEKSGAPRELVHERWPQSELVELADPSAWEQLKPLSCDRTCLLEAPPPTWLFVIARNSSFVYKGKAVEVRQVGCELDVRYVLEGGVRKAGNHLRNTAQLIEAETGVHLWADKCDGGMDDVFDLQNQITDRVIGIVEPSLQRSEIERSRRKPSAELLAGSQIKESSPTVEPKVAHRAPDHS